MIHSRLPGGAVLALASLVLAIVGVYAVIADLVRLPDEIGLRD